MYISITYLDLECYRNQDTSQRWSQVIIQEEIGKSKFKYLVVGKRKDIFKAGITATSELMNCRNFTSVD